ncbi:MAG: YbbR-like domain-containing protein, partial [Victivallaceae bacterium]|nr:YbbR-like domain-containing protein [Victivallaceae bacterium]
AGLVNANPKPVTVTLTVRGSRRDLQSRIKPMGRVEVDENRFVRGKSHRIELALADFTSTNGIQVIGVDDRDRVLELSLQRRVTRSLPVRASFIGRLSPDYVRGEVSCVPETVEVTGPEKTVSALKSMTTEDIPLDPALTESFSYSTRLVNPHGLLIGAKDDSVQVQVAIEKNYQDRRFASVPVALLSSPGAEKHLRYELLEPGMVEIELRGLKGAVSTLPRAAVRPFLDMEKYLEPGVYDVPVGCYFGGTEIEVKQLTPSSIKVKVSK